MLIGLAEEGEGLAAAMLRKLGLTPRRACGQCRHRLRRKFLPPSIQPFRHQPLKSRENPRPMGVRAGL
ncbi:hypothetical protein [Paracoccus mutanolyticus]|uniref:hypothetical protein n=1 Tax=Paracoccus mutanolyticus TaxID=1499308 RepID=UPI0021D5393A|nr:hypothetical protein [Paracoccus mutanolyticus]